MKKLSYLLLLLPIIIFLAGFFTASHVSAVGYSDWVYPTHKSSTGTTVSCSSFANMNTVDSTVCSFTGNAWLVFPIDWGSFTDDILGVQVEAVTTDGTTNKFLNLRHPNSDTACASGTGYGWSGSFTNTFDGTGSFEFNAANTSDPADISSVLSGLSSARNCIYATVIDNVSSNNQTDIDMIRVRVVLDSATVFGCTDPLADNYDSEATVDDDSCTYSSPPSQPNDPQVQVTDWIDFDFFNGSTAQELTNTSEVDGVTDIFWSGAFNGAKFMATTPQGLPIDAEVVGITIGQKWLGGYAPSRPYQISYCSAWSNSDYQCNPADYWFPSFTVDGWIRDTYTEHYIDISMKSSKIPFDDYTLAYIVNFSLTAEKPELDYLQYKLHYISSNTSFSSGIDTISITDGVVSTQVSGSFTNEQVFDEQFCKIDFFNAATNPYEIIQSTFVDNKLNGVLIHGDYRDHITRLFSLDNPYNFATGDTRGWTSSFSFNHTPGEPLDLGYRYECFYSDYDNDGYLTNIRGTGLSHEQFLGAGTLTDQDLSLLDPCADADGFLEEQICALRQSVIEFFKPDISALSASFGRNSELYQNLTKKAPFAYVIPVFDIDWSAPAASNEFPTLEIPSGIGSTYSWDMPPTLYSILTTLKNAISVGLWFMFVLHVLGLHRSLVS